MKQDAARESRQARRGAWRMAIGYLLIATAWILGSDHLAALIARDAEELLLIQSVKGMAFVVVMAVFVGLSAIRLARSEAARQQERYLATTDPVTQLPNAHAFYAAVADELASGERARCCMLLLDIRGFGRINATFGRLTGDRILKNVGRRLRMLGTAEGRTARLEEDKFAVLFPVDSPDDATAFADRVIEALPGEMHVSGQKVPLDINVGYALGGEDGDNVAALLDAAELALRAAKETGRNVGQRFSHELLRSRREHFHLEAELRLALAERKLTVQLQPQFELATGRLDSAEALVRWQHSGRGDISPAVFIPVAEQSGLIDRVGEYVLNDVCRCLYEWREAGLPPLRIAVNVAGQQLDDQRLGFYLQQAAEEWDMPLSSLEIEITESMAMRDPDRAVEVLGYLRSLGVTIALDDFGTGYSSLSYLLQLPVDKLKIDRRFISGLDEDPRQRSFVRTLIALGRELGIRVVAEGIETAAQRRHLGDLGCDLGQGYLLGRPMSMDDFRALLTGLPGPAP